MVIHPGHIDAKKVLNIIWFTSFLQLNILLKRLKTEGINTTRENSFETLN
jgi:hypothetical protein